MKPVAIIGGGITGLTAAFYLHQKNIPVILYEASGRVGGAIQSLRRAGYLAEAGPNTLLETSPKISQLVRDAGLTARRMDANPKAAARYLVRYRRPRAMPGSPLGFLTTSLFTLKAKLAVLREPFVPRRREGAEESVAEFVKRRLNQEFLDQAIDALAGGIYAGDPHKLSLTRAFPKLALTEATYGSLIKGQLFGARDRKRSGEISKDRAPKFSFDEGLQVLPDTLRELLGEAVRLNTSVIKLAKISAGWSLALREHDRELSAEHSAVIYCGTAFRLAALQVELPRSAAVPAAARADVQGPGSSERAAPAGSAAAGTAALRFSELNLTAFSEIRHPPVASVVLGFRREEVAHPLNGFGMLIPKVEGFNILGTIFSSSLFPNRAPAGHVTLTSYVGGERQPELATLPPEKLFALVQDDLRVLLGVRGEPTFEHNVFWPKAIPQYNVGYGRFQDLMSEIETKAPGLFFAGHYREGVSLGDSIVSGCNAAERVARFF